MVLEFVRAGSPAEEKKLNKCVLTATFYRIQITLLLADFAAFAVASVALALHELAVKDIVRVRCWQFWQDCALYNFCGFRFCFSRWCIF